MNDSPFTTIGDEPIEARIVAWVLGEASAFEAAELERLCEERPELLVFRRRMCALHGLLTESEAAQPDEGWKLPPEKRAKLDELFGEEKIVNLDAEKEKRVSRSGRRALLGIAACLLLTLIIAGLMLPPRIEKARRSASTPRTWSSISDPGTNEMVPLASNLPPELIEGTPKPINEPNLEPPVDGPAGWSSRSLAMNDRLADSNKPQMPPAPSSGPKKVAAKQPETRKSLEELKSEGNEIADASEETAAASEQAEVMFGGSGTGGGGSGSGAVGRAGGQASSNLAEAKMNVQPAAPQSAAAPQPLAEPSAQGAFRDHSLARGDEMLKQRQRESALKNKEDVTRSRSGKPQDDARVDGDSDASLSKLEKEISGLREQLNEPSVDDAKKQFLFRKGQAKEREVTPLRQEQAQEQAQLAAELPNTPSDSAATSELSLRGYAGGALTMANQSSVGSDSKDQQLGKKLAEATPMFDAFSDGDNRAPTAGASNGGKDGKVSLKNKAAPAPSIPPPVFSSSAQNARVAAAPVSGSAIRSNPALTYENTQNVDKVRRSLYAAEGSDKLGKYDGAKQKYEEVLRVDPYNDAARRGLERVTATESENMKAGNDEPRSELLGQVDFARTLSAQMDSEVDEAPSEKPTATVPPKPALTELKSASDPKIIALQKAIRDQEDKVEERRKALATIVRTKGVIYKGSDSFYGAAGVDEDQGARSALDAFNRLEQEKIQLESQFNSMLKYNGDQLMMYSGGLELPNNIVRKLYPQYLEMKRQVEGLKIKGLSEQHPKVQEVQANLSSMQHQIDEGVAKLRATIKAQLDLTTERIKSVEVMKDETREEAIKRGLDAQNYVEAKKEFEKDQELLQQMKLKLQAPAAEAETEPPKPALTEFIEEISTTENPYSTFSLNVSDASFQIAQAALAKGERPDPAGIKVEQFYNAFDYGDPAPSSGEPVAHSIEQCANPIIPGRNLVRVALKTAAAGRSAAQPLRLTLLVDQSGSMVRDDRRAAMEKALAGLTTLLTKNDLVTVIGFSRTPRLLADGMPGDQAEKLGGLVNQSASEGGTNLEEAIKLGEQLAERRKLAGAQNRIVLFTDGAANLGNADPVRLAEKIKVLRQNGIAFDIAGIAAEGLNDELLGELARNGNGRYYVVGKGGDDDIAKQLAGAFHPAAENVKVQVHFNPERVGRYKLIGFEKDRLKTEDFRNDSVDAAELAAEEAGVAIYQVEPLADGKGELGEVSVRFRDSASDQMVERTWTIPHDSNVPTMDRATPSMQLALLSMLVAEKLKGGALADAIDLKQFAEPRASVKSSYGNNVRVADMLHMLDALK
ncbi:MAG: von Willebrand factor type A domain-containing protein [Gloeobacteraceae cyanobacterium ES-bin-144]|nr:von Willebrand factor type A domain-containing protein [Verrucomicrobiales bacterium]